MGGHGEVGGDPDTIRDGGSGLTGLSSGVTGRAATLDGAAKSTGHSALDAALKRFTAAASQYATDVGGQLEAAGTLATNASADLRNAGGG